MDLILEEREITLEDELNKYDKIVISPKSSSRGLYVQVCGDQIEQYVAVNYYDYAGSLMGADYGSNYDSNYESVDAI